MKRARAAEEQEGDIEDEEQQQKESSTAGRFWWVSEANPWWQVRNVPSTQHLTPQALPRLARGFILSACTASPRVWRANDIYVRFLWPGEPQDPIEIDGGFLRRDWVLKKENKSTGVISWLFVQSKKRTELGLRCVTTQVPREWRERRHKLPACERALLFLVYELRERPQKSQTSSIRTTTFHGPAPPLPPPPAAAALQSIPPTSAPFIEHELESLDKQFQEDIAELRTNMVRSFTTRAKELIQEMSAETWRETERLSQKYQGEFRRMQQMFAGSTQVGPRPASPASIPSSSQDNDPFTELFQAFMEC